MLANDMYIEVMITFFNNTKELKLFINLGSFLFGYNGKLWKFNKNVIQGKILFCYENFHKNFPIIHTIYNSNSRIIEILT